MPAARAPRSAADTVPADALEALPRTPATSVKTLGWRGVMQAMRDTGRLLVTNHDRPEAVILSTEAYVALVRAAEGAPPREADVLAALRARFDARLAELDAADAGDRLRAAMDAPAELRGEVEAGGGF